eukprot:g2748.t1
MSCIGQSLGVKSLTSSVFDLQLVGLKFIETVVIMYSESGLLQSASSSRGSPSQDMLLSNCRYLISQILEQLELTRTVSLGQQQNTSAIEFVKSLTTIATQRVQFLNSILPRLVQLIQDDVSIRVASLVMTTVTRSDSTTSMNLALTIKQCFLDMMECSISSRQKMSILEGLSLLGEKPGQRSESTEGPFGAKQSSKGVGAFTGKLELDEVQTLLEILMKKGHGLMCEKLCEKLPEDFVINLVLHNFQHAPELPQGGRSKKDRKVGIKRKPQIQTHPVKGEKTQKMTPMEITSSDRLILTEFSCAKLMKLADDDQETEGGLEDRLTVGMKTMTKLSANQNPDSVNIPLDLILTFIASSFQTRGVLVHELVIELMFSLFLKYSSSPEGTVHDRVLIRILEIISEQQFSSKDRSVRNLLLELPSLPAGIIQEFFRKMLKKDSTTASSFLITAVALMEAKPLLKAVLLNCILESCVTEDLEIREKAIRLVKNRLHVDSELIEQIERFATDNLRSLTSHHNDADAGRRCHLYLALCTRKASLLRTLMEVYAQVNESDKIAIQENTKQLSEAMPYLLPEIFHLINALPDGSEKLLLFLISIFPDRVPPQPVVDACLERYNASKNIRFLVPILPGLPKKRVLEIVPLLTELPVEEFTPIITELVNQPQFSDEAIEPSEILIALMTSADNASEATSLNTIRTSLDHCIKRLASVFDKEVLAGTLNKLIHMGTLPMLFMRTVLLAVSREKELGSFVLQTVLSPTVVTSKIKTEESQWRGYLLLLQRLIPTAFLHLLSLPTRLMNSALIELPRNFTEQFAGFLSSEESAVRVSKEAVSAIEQILNDHSEAGASKKTSSSPAGQSDPENSTSVKSNSAEKASPTTASDGGESLKKPNEQINN